MRGGAGGAGGEGGAAGAGGAGAGAGGPGGEGAGACTVGASAGTGLSSATASGAGAGAGRGAGFFTAGLGEGAGGGGAGGGGWGGGGTTTGGAEGAGGAGTMNPSTTSAGMAVATAGRSRPACSAHRPAAWISTTPPTTSALRGRDAAGAKRSGCGMRQGCTGNAAGLCVGKRVHGGRRRFRGRHRTRSTSRGLRGRQAACKKPLHCRGHRGCPGGPRCRQSQGRRDRGCKVQQAPAKTNSVLAASVKSICIGNRTAREEKKPQQCRVSTLAMTAGTQHHTRPKPQTRRPGGAAGFRPTRAVPTALLRCAGRPPGAWHGTGPPRRVRNLRSSRTGCPRPVQTGFRQNPCRPGHGGQFRGRKLGGRHKQSWQWSV